MQQAKRASLLDNSRFYVLASTFLLSALIVAWLRLTVADDQLFIIRTEQLYGLCSVVYLYLALVIAPLGTILGKRRISHVAFARRAIGVSAAYFAILHAVVAWWGQLGAISGMRYMPPLFLWSITCGVIALAILLALAFTSFDWAISLMGFPRWKRLQRLVYGGGVLILLHIWAIGTHVADTPVQITAFAALAALSGLELYRAVARLAGRWPKAYSATLFLAGWATVLIALLLLPSFIQGLRG
jgi:sulfoxide reductase heme-binding subunit YedZ